MPFIARIELSEVEDSKAAFIVKGKLEGIRILLVEDAIDNQILLERMLTSLGAKVSLAKNGIEGVREAFAQHHDLILMDLQMPELDGFEATRQLRQSGYDRPIIALSAHAMREEREHSLNVGCNDHLTKPINFRCLVETVRRYTGAEHT